MASGKRVGYAVVGLGSISQVAVLPAFAHSKKAKLIAVVSGDKNKAAKYAQDFKARPSPMTSFPNASATLSLKPCISPLRQANMKNMR
jgi:predicted dehydrogenase